MSVSAIDITCDGCLVMESVPWQEDGIAAYLRALGWIVHTARGEHYCPECAKKRRLQQQQSRRGENNA